MFRKRWKNFGVDSCGGILTKNKTTEVPVYTQTSQKEPDEIKVSISIEHWDQMYDPTPTNHKALKIGWIQVWFERLDE